LRGMVGSGGGKQKKTRYGKVNITDSLSPCLSRLLQERGHSLREKGRRHQPMLKSSAHWGLAWLTGLPTLGGGNLPREGVSGIMFLGYISPEFDRCSQPDTQDAGR